MSVQATSWVWDHSQTKGAARLVMLCLANYAGRDGGDCYPSQVTIAYDCGIDERTVRRALKEAIDLGEVRIETPSAGRGVSTRYRITMTTLSNPQAGENSGDNGLEKADILPGSPEKRRTSTTEKADILSEKGGRGAPRTVNEPLRTAKSTFHSWGKDPDPAEDIQRAAQVKAMENDQRQAENAKAPPAKIDKADFAAVKAKLQPILEPGQPEA